MIRYRLRRAAQFVEMDLRNLMANPLAFTLPVVVIIFINLLLLNATIVDFNPQSHLVEIETYLLLNTLFGSLLSIPIEIREKYSERIQYEFITYARRIGVRLVTNSLMGVFLCVIPYLALTVQNISPKLALDFVLHDFSMLILAAIFISTLATHLGALVKNYLLLSILGSLIFLLQVTSPISDRNWWAFSTFVYKIIGREDGFNSTLAYVKTFLIEVQFWIITTSPFGMRFNRGRARIGKKFAKKVTTSHLGNRRILARLPLRYSLALAQSSSITAHVALIPFSILVFLIYPLLNSADILSILDVNQRLPILTSLLCTTILSAVISMGAYKLSSAEEERDALPFGSLRIYQRTIDQVVVSCMTAISLSLVCIYFAYLSLSDDFPASSKMIRAILVILIFVPLFAALGRKVVRLKIDVRFYVLFSLVVPLGEMIISSIAPDVAGYLPSSILAHLCGGDGLYEFLPMNG